ncbi:MAG: diguanylate cyclase [Thermacetogeniaceae bacterium]
MNKSLRVLLVEDSEYDAKLLIHELEQGGYDPFHELVETYEAMASALEKQEWDLIIADYVMPHFGGLEALKLMKDRGLDLPFIIVSGKIGEDVAVSAMKAGAHDYLLKDNLTRLNLAIERELREVVVRQERKQAEEALSQKAAELQAVFQAIPDLYFRLKADGTFQELLAGDSADLYLPIVNLLGKRVQDVSKRIGQQFQQAIDRVLQTRSLVMIEYNLSINGERKFFEARFLPLLDDQVIAVIHNITEHKQLEEHLRYLCFHDILTGIYNRSFFEEERKRLNTKRQLPLSIIMGDVNGLKLVNDTLGHLAGDELLIHAANILKENCRKEDIICRWGGDEFAVLLPQTDQDNAERICNQLREACKKTEKESMPVSFAWGVATRERIDQEFDLVLRDAEGLMYQDKLQNSRNTRLSTVSFKDP